MFFFLNFSSLHFSGGLKIWECTYDLLQYLMHNKDIIEFQDKNVLDLGCGAGILGIYALQNGANVTFQDYVSSTTCKNWSFM